MPLLPTNYKDNQIQGTHFLPKTFKLNVSRADVHPPHPSQTILFSLRLPNNAFSLKLHSDLSSFVFFSFTPVQRDDLIFMGLHELHSVLLGHFYSTKYCLNGTNELFIC